MFGYVRPLTPELKVRDHELYKAVYCGLCRSMGKHISLLSRLTLNYDVVFLVMVRYALTAETTNIQKFRCKLNPFRKRAALHDSETLIYCSCAAALLIYYKYADDLRDTKNFFMRGIKYLSAPFFVFIKYRANRIYPELGRLINESLICLHECEKAGSASPDETANHFAELMKLIAGYGLEGSNAEISGEIGAQLGRWLYFIDALDDVESDFRRKEFNPLLRAFGNPEAVRGQAEVLKTSLTCCLDRIDLAVSLIDSSGFSHIIDNIVKLGLVSVQEKILFN